MMTIHVSLPRQLHRGLVSLTLLAACGGSVEGDDGTATAADDSAPATNALTDDASLKRELAPAVPPITFRHPGLLLTQTRMDTLKAAWNSVDASAMKTGYQLVLNYSRSAYSYSHEALSSVKVVSSASNDQEARYKNDAQAAYLNALRWVKTGDARHRDKAVAILNDWARTFRSYSLGPGTDAAQAQLEAAWVLPVWLSAAEIIRHYNHGEAGWSQADIRTFSGFVDRQYHEAAQARTRVNNWAVSAALAMMAAGVYQDDPTHYALGLQRAIEMIPLSVFASGEVHELKDRDCKHPQYNLEGLAQAAEIAVIQADDTSVWLWRGAGETVPRLAKGLEYMARSLQSGSGVRSCVGQRLEAGYVDIAVNGYMNRGVAIPNLQALAKARRPDGGSSQFLGWTTATHGRDDY